MHVTHGTVSHDAVFAMLAQLPMSERFMRAYPCTEYCSVLCLVARVDSCYHYHH